MHPDLNPGNASAESLFKALNEAYSVLSDASARREYDARYRHAGLAAPLDSRGPQRARARAPPYTTSGSSGAVDWGHEPRDAAMRAAWVAHFAKHAASSSTGWGAGAAAAAAATIDARRAARAAASAARASMAERGASETHAYRVWASHWRASQAASERVWPLALLTAAIAAGVAYQAIGGVTRQPRGGGEGVRGSTAARSPG